MVEQGLKARARRRRRSTTCRWQRARLNGKQVAHQLDWSPSWVSRLLSGKRGASQLHVAAILGLCRVTGAERERLLALCQDQNTPGWRQQHGSRLPKQLRKLIDHEDKAVAISDFQAMRPGLLQTGDYARAMIRDPRTVPADEVEDRVTARLARQRLLSRDRPARFTFFIHEFVLRLPVGGPAVMSDQLNHLLRVSVRPCLTLHPAGGACRARRARRNRRAFQSCWSSPSSSRWPTWRARPPACSWSDRRNCRLPRPGRPHRRLASLSHHRHPLTARVIHRVDDVPSSVPVMSDRGACPFC